ncbi:hypothetical protein K438DRAFT_1781644 [Mycena galopus ATCC 62051]|nr:hypothetical protein K438DRAFT_1781644 [Mycena galopus ATCC 62051]
MSPPRTPAIKVLSSAAACAQRLTAAPARKCVVRLAAILRLRIANIALGGLRCSCSLVATKEVGVRGAVQPSACLGRFSPAVASSSAFICPAAHVDAESYPLLHRRSPHLLPPPSVPATARAGSTGQNHARRGDAGFFVAGSREESCVARFRFAAPAIGI